MTVPKGRRKDSQFEVFHHSTSLRLRVMELISRNFGYRRKPKEGLPEFEAMVQENTFRFLRKEQEYVIEILRDMSSNITMANKVYPTILEELTERRIYQDRAIARCYDLANELTFCMELLPNVNINTYLPYADMINKQIALLKGWRKSDNRLKDAIVAKTNKK